jgi:hypothetical protein
MNDKTFKIARLIRLAIFLGILFSFAWMFRWELGTTSATDTYIKLDRWTGTIYGCEIRAIAIRSGRGSDCEQEATPVGFE